jgi:hypothetical protein
MLQGPRGGIAGFVAIVLMCGSGEAQVTAPQRPIRPNLEILSATFGTLGRSRKLDIAARLQQLCTDEAQSCQIFCSETSFGRYRIGSQAICRVAYRCESDGGVRSVEAAREEPILMSCPKRDDAMLLPPPFPS